MGRFDPYRSAAPRSNGGIEIEVKNGMKFLIDENDLDLVSRYIWHANGSGERYYVNGRLIDKSNGDQRISLHRLLTNAPKGVIVDHINGNTLDNRRSNLRLCDFSQNTANGKKRVDSATSQFKGVSKRSGKYRSPWRLQVKSKGNYYSEDFETEIEAALAYDRKAMEMHGDFAALNFPRELHSYLTQLTDRIVESEAQNGK